MINFSIHKVKTSLTPYKTESGKEYSSTAAIMFYDDNKREVDYIERAYVDSEDIYKLIDSGQEINLDECYVENFSLKTYRQSRNIEIDKRIVLNNFSAKNTIFDSKICTDFSFVDFAGEKINFEYSNFITGDVSMHECHFPDGDISFAHCNFGLGNAIFSKSVFGNGSVEFKNAIFGDGNIDFEFVDFGPGEKSFVNTEFGHGDVSFLNANFNDGKTSFKVARFGSGKVDFHYSVFGSDDISFERTEFGDGRVDFRKVEFGRGKVNFNRAVFGDGDIDFEGIQLESGKLTFTKTIFGSGIINFELCEMENADIAFNNTSFGIGNLYFSQSKFHKIEIISCHLNNYCDFRVSYCKYFDLSDCIVRDIADLTPYEHAVDIHMINFSGIRILGRIYVDWRDNRIKQLINSQKKTTYRVKSEQFRILKQNFNVTGKYDDEDRAYIEFKRNEAKAILTESIEKKKISKLWRYPSYWFKLWIFDRMGLYATSPTRVLISVVISLFFLTFVQFILPFFVDTYINCIAEDATLWTRFWDTFYYSGVSYFTIGYGDCSPVGFLRYVSDIEGFVGVFMMSYFTVAFARKILR